METSAIISFSDASISQREFVVLNNVSFAIDKGEFVYLVGRVGSGKSSLIRTINAELPLISGEAVIAGYDLSAIKTKDIPFLRRKLGVVFQDFKLLSDRTIYDNLAFVLKSTGWKNANEINERIEQTLEAVGMVDKRTKMPHQLSGGEQQHIVIARALLNEPEIILADEPTGNLDTDTSFRIMELFLKIQQQGKTVIVATHDRLVIERFPMRTLICENGTVNQLNAKNEEINFKDMVD